MRNWFGREATPFPSRRYSSGAVSKRAISARCVAPVISTLCSTSNCTPPFAAGSRHRTLSRPSTRPHVPYRRSTSARLSNQFQSWCLPHSSHPAPPRAPLARTRHPPAGGVPCGRCPRALARWRPQHRRKPRPTRVDFPQKLRLSGFHERQLGSARHHVKEIQHPLWHNQYVPTTTTSSRPLTHTHAVVLTTVWCELMSDPFLFATRSAPSRDHKVLGALALFCGGFVGRALVDQIGSPGALGVGACVRVCIAIGWTLVPARAQ